MRRPGMEKNVHLCAAQQMDAFTWCLTHSGYSNIYSTQILCFDVQENVCYYDMNAFIVMPSGFWLKGSA